jgi:hypothetical protein
LQLGKFATIQRTLYRNGALLAERYDKLVELGFVFEPEYARTSWEVRFQQLVDFNREHGHFDAPDTNKALQRWVMIQRDDYPRKYKHMTGYRLHKLQAINFDWEQRDPSLVCKKRVKMRR